MTNYVASPTDPFFHQLESEKLQRWELSQPYAYWEYRHKWVEYPKNRTVDSFPIHLDIEATNACNLKCIMCPRTEMVENGTFWSIEMFDFDKYKEIIDEGVAKGLCSVKYNYLGEPTLNPQLTDMISYAKQAGVLDTMLNTNATQLDEDLSRDLILIKLDKIFFSFDSPYREKYNRIRVNSDYDKVLYNIRCFNEIREEMGSIKPFTRVSMVMMRDNKDDWDAFQQLFRPIVDSVSYGDFINHIGQSKPEYSLVTDGKENFCCPLLWQRMFIHPDGVATVCCNDAMRSLKVGNVFEQSVESIWTGKEYQRLRELHATGRFREIPTCANC